MSTPRPPPGIPYILGNEAAERFSYYGMKAILVVYMVGFLQDAGGGASPMSEAEAKTWYHLFSASNYFFPIVGALIADIFLGKYRTILALSICYCFGHAALAASDTRTGLFLGLMLIAVGSGGIKPCVSAHVGDQFKKEQEPLLARYFGWFYLAINGGAFVSTLATPWLLEHWGAHVAFGVPGVLMLLATAVFYAGRNKFVAVAPVGWPNFRKALCSCEGIKSVRRLSLLYVFVAVFWALYDQTGSAWVLQAQHLNRVVDLRSSYFDATGLRFEVLPAQLQALNPLLIFLYVPLLSVWIYPWLGKRMQLTALKKIGAGFILTAIAFFLLAWVEVERSRGVTPSIAWQVLGYFIVTAAEVLVYWTGLEFAYTQSSRELKSFMMGLYLLSISLGNVITALLNYVLTRSDGSSFLTQAQYFSFFAIFMLLTTVAYVPFAKRYR